MHIIHINGNVGRDGELRSTQSGTPVLAFPLASKDRGETTWFDCAVFGERAKKLEPHIKKGTGLAICGVPKLSLWKKGSGEPGGKIEVNVDKLDFTGGGQRQETEQKPEPEPRGGQSADSGGDLNDSIPFVSWGDLPGKTVL